MPHFGWELIFVSLFVVAFAENVTTPLYFQCYHGESNGTKPMDLLDCPTGTCITYVSPCHNYWATTCYNDSHPMKILNAFKTVKQLKPSSFLLCSKSHCNNENQTILSRFGVHAIYKYPKSYNNFLWPNLGKEKRSKIFENGMVLENLKDNHSSSVLVNEAICVFMGQTYINSKKVWIEYPYYDDSKAYGLRLRLTFDLKKSVLIFKKSNKTSSISGKMELKEKLISGQIINITFSSPDNINFTLWINGEKINWLPKFFVLGFFDLIIKYGGKWSYLNKYANEIPQISPVYPYPSPSDYSKNDCDEDFLQHFKPITKLNYTIIDFNDSFPYYLKSNDTILIPNEIKEFELRESLCPQSISHRFKFEPYLNGSNIYYNFFYFVNSAYNTGIYHILSANIAQNCDEISLTCSNSTGYHLEIACENFFQKSRVVLFHSFYPIEFKNPKYLVEGPKSTFKC